MRFVRYRKRNYGHSIQEPIDKDNLNWTRRDFWDSSGFWWPTGITNYNKQLRLLNIPSHKDVVSTHLQDPNEVVKALHKIRIWI